MYWFCLPQATVLWLSPSKVSSHAREVHQALVVLFIPSQRLRPYGFEIGGIQYSLSFSTCLIEEA